MVQEAYRSDIKVACNVDRLLDTTDYLHTLTDSRSSQID